MNGETSNPPWPDSADRPVLFLIDAANGIERRLLTDWIESTRSAGSSVSYRSVVLPILYGVKGRLETGSLPDELDAEGETLIVPVRVVWLPASSAGGLRFRDLLLGDPRHPGRLGAQLILRSDPGRARCIVGASATLDALRSGFEDLQQQDDVAADPLAAHIVRRAGLALDVAERRLRGNRYKVPHYVADSLRTSPKFNQALEALAIETNKPVEELREEARDYMKELIARPSSFFIDWMGKVTRFICSLGYGDDMVYDEEGLERTRQVLRDYPAAILWTHKSHIDGMAVLSMLYENDLPSPHSFGGINMAFGGIGWLGRKSGIIYIRRTFQDNPVYKLVFRHYLGYLMEKRFPFSWAFEGTRSRVGKLMPPRYGMFKYVLEAAHTTRTEDLHFVPVNISYDLIGEVADYALEQSGAPKRPESLGWFLDYIRKMRAPKGRIYIDFGEPVVIKGPTPEPDDAGMSRLAFDVAVGVNQITPVTFPALACMALLGVAPRALTFAEFQAIVAELLAWIRKRGIRLADHFDEGHDKQLAELAQLTIDRGLVSVYDEGAEPIYGIAEDRHVIASYYRNTIAHYFVNKAILELALVSAADVRARSRLEAFWAETDRLRDLFKFEFFYSQKDTFRAQLEEELSHYAADWEKILTGRRQGIADLLSDMQPQVAHATLTPYIEAYSIVADVLQRLGPNDQIDSNECVARCLKFGKQRYLQRRISSQASIAKLLFANGYKLFDNLGVTGVGENVQERRRELTREFVELADRLEKIKTIARSAYSARAAAD